MARASLALVAGLVAGFGYAPREVVQGNVQRIMYLHVPSILAGYLAFVARPARPASATS